MREGGKEKGGGRERERRVRERDSKIGQIRLKEEGACLCNSGFYAILRTHYSILEIRKCVLFLDCALKLCNLEIA